jgi:hypothetical protein
MHRPPAAISDLHAFDLPPYISIQEFCQSFSDMRAGIAPPPLRGRQGGGSRAQRTKNRAAHDPHMPSPALSKLRQHPPP